MTDFEHNLTYFERSSESLLLRQSPKETKNALSGYIFAQNKTNVAIYFCLGSIWVQTCTQII
jgi:hypothetical protein